jgi:hypothetical protein
MQNASWEEVAEYVAAGSLGSVKIEDDFTNVQLEILYAHGGSLEQFRVIIHCLGFCYVDLRRRDDHEPGAGMILEAYLHKASPLIDALFAHKLESKAGCLLLEGRRDKAAVKHLEIIGELSVNILCEKVSFTISRIS